MTFRSIVYNAGEWILSIAARYRPVTLSRFAAVVQIDIDFFQSTLCTLDSRLQLLYRLTIILTL